MKLYTTLSNRYGPAIDPITRREFLQSTLAAGAGLFLSQYPLSAADASHKPPLLAKRVLIVGAGLAGLACAYELRNTGHDVTIIEARPRIGGRVQTLTDFIPGKTVEAGGEFIGSNHPAWLAYARRFNLRLIPSEEDSKTAESPIFLDGKHLTPKEEVALWEEMRFSLNLMNRDATLINPDQPWKSKRADNLDNRTTLEWLNSLNLTDQCRRAVRAQLENDNAVSLEHQSYLANLTMVRGGGMEKYWTESEAFRCLGGNQLLCMRFAEAIGYQHIHLNTAVKEIDLTHATAKIVANDKTIEADEVVLAVPPSTWSGINFSPSLPAELHPQMGPALKYLSAVKEPFWKNTNQAAYSIGDDLAGWTWNGTARQTNKKDCCLTSFSGGPAAEQAREIDSEQRKASYTEALSERYPGYSENLTGTRFYDWSTEPYTKRGYAFPAPRQITTQGPLWQKAFAGKLYFAGEHTCYKFIGYMEGALQSGIAAAHRIARHDMPTPPLSPSPSASKPA